MLLRDKDHARLLKALVYGKSGSGKTHLGVTAPDPVVLLSERQGFETIRDAAARLGRPLPPTFWVRSVDDLREALRILGTSKAPLEHMQQHFGSADEQDEPLPYATPQTVVLDSMTDIAQLVSDDIDRIAPPRKGKDGLPVKAERYWGVLGDRMHGLIRAFRDLPYHVLFLALLDDRTVGEGEEAARQVGPMMPMRKMPAMLESAVNAVGVASVKQVPVKGQDVELQHGVTFAAPDWIMTKPLRPLRDREVADFGDWVQRWGGGNGR